MIRCTLKCIDHFYAGQDQPPVQEHSEKTPQPEDAELTNKERRFQKVSSCPLHPQTTSVLVPELTHSDQNKEVEEDTMGDHYVDDYSGAHGMILWNTHSQQSSHTALAVEELKDFEGEIDGAWDDELDGEGDPDTTWEAEQENGDESVSNESSVTLSSKASKRSFDEFGIEHSEDESFVSGSPGVFYPFYAPFPILINT